MAQAGESYRRQLHGPKCPKCSKPMRRRRYWSLHDSASCKPCGVTAECIGGGDDPIFLFSVGGKPATYR